MSKQSRKEISNSLIEVLRQLVDKRYQYKNLKANFNLDPYVTEIKVDEVRTFFLTHVYPPSNDRETLNAAFENLDKHLKNPIHLLDLLGSGAALVFKFGLQFPKAIKASLKSLDAFRKAIAFETALCDEAIERKLTMPISEQDFERLICKLPREQVVDFVNSSDELLISLTDTKLLAKSVDILEELIEKMKGKSNIYDQLDIEGITLGLEILRGGYALFKDMSDKEKKIMIDLILKVERKNLETIFATYE